MTKMDRWFVMSNGPNAWSTRDWCIDPERMTLKGGVLLTIPKDTWNHLQVSDRCWLVDMMRAVL